MILLLMILFVSACPAGLWFSLVLNQKEHTQQLAISLPSLHMFIHKKPLPDWSLIYFTHHVLQASTSYFSYVLRLYIILLLLPTFPEFDVLTSLKCL